MRTIGIVPVACPRCDERNTFSDWEWLEKIREHHRLPDEEVPLRCQSCRETSHARDWQRKFEQEAIKRAGLVTPRMQKEQRA
jgi:hypothetical protein